MELKIAYWKSSNSSDIIYKCETESLCNGDSKSNYCVLGHKGPLCKFCDESGKIWNGTSFQLNSSF